MARLVVVSNRVAVPSRLGANRAGGLVVAIRPVQATPYQEYYNGYANNRVLWWILHYRLDLAEFSRHDLSGYIREGWTENRDRIRDLRHQAAHASS